VAWWSVDGDATDATGHHHDGTTSGGVNRTLSANDILYLYSRIPWLNITRADQQVVLSWLAPDEGWVLEWTNSIPPVEAPWPQVLPPYETNGGGLQFIEPASLNTRFYRLHKP
jgi:hypothetical protein